LKAANTFDGPPNLDPFESWAAAKSMNIAQLAIWADNDFARTAKSMNMCGLDVSEAIRKNQQFLTSGQSEAVNASAREPEKVLEPFWERDHSMPSGDDLSLNSPAGFAMQIYSNRTEGIGCE
jgi:hypothetical protein